MGSMIEANKVGDKYRDVTGTVSTIVHVDASRVVIRRAGRGWPTFSAFDASRTRVIGSGFRTLAEALSA